MLYLRDFKKRYNEKLVIEAKEYTFSKGVHWVKGQNGSGKTTLFKSVAGLLPFEGEIKLQDISLKKDPIAYRLTVNYAEAEPVFPAYITGEEMVNLFVKYKKADKAQVTDLQEHLDIDFLKEPFGTYSSGMGKKLSLLLAFLGSPQLILLDEPLITLDVKATAALLHLVQSYQKKKEVSFLISSHQLFEEGSLVPDYVHEVSNQSITQHGLIS